MLLEPLRELRQTEDAMNRLWRGFGGGNGTTVENWSVPLDVVREGDSLIVRASLPGVDPDNIDVSIEDNVLTIKASAQRYKNGVLTITVPRAEAKKARYLKVLAN